MAFPAVVLLSNGAYVVLKQYLPSIGQLIGIDDFMQDTVQQFGSWPLLVSVLFIGLGPGLGEELWCRAFLGRGLVGRYGVVVGILLTSVLFGLIHVDPRQGTMAALTGLVLHCIYQMGRSLWLPILLHFLNNSLAVAAAHLQNRLRLLDAAPETIPVEVYAAAAALLAAVGLALFQSRARLVPGDESVPLWRPRFAGVAVPPPDSGIKVVHSSVNRWAISALLAASVLLAAYVVAFT
jgi:membrane protease YdiL (CAAX protease family)